MDNTGTQPLNPWLSLWTRPRDTIQQIIDNDPEHLVLLLAALPALIQALGTAGIFILKGAFGRLLLSLAIAIGGAIFGIISLYINSAVLRWTGRSPLSQGRGLKH